MEGYRQEKMINTEFGIIEDEYENLEEDDMTEED